MLREAWMEQKTKSQAWAQLQIWNQTPTWLFFSTPSKFFFAWKKAQMEQKGKKSNLGVILNLEPTPIWHFFAPSELLFVATH
jgi:hypothetical protein